MSQSSPNWRRNLTFVWISQFLSTAGFCFASPFIPFYIQDLGVSDIREVSFWVSMYTAAGYLSFCLSCPVWGFLSDIFGRRIMILRANFVSAACVVLMIFVPGPLMLTLVRFVMGAFGGTVTACQILISGTTPRERRGFALGALSSAVYGGMMAGTFFGGIIVDQLGYRRAFMICALILTVSGLLVLFGATESFVRTATLRDKMASISLKLPDFGAVWLILLLILMMGFAGRFTRPYLAILVEEINGPDLAATWTGVIASLTAVSGVLSGFILGWLADRTSAPRVAIWSAFFAGLLTIPQGLAINLGVLTAAQFGMVFCAGGLDPIFQIWLAKSTPDDRRGLFFGWASSAKSCGWFLCSLASGAVAVSWGVRSVYFCSAVIFLSLVPVIKLTVAAIAKMNAASTSDSF